MADNEARRQADAYLRQPDPNRLDWQKTGNVRTRRFLWWSWQEREERRLVFHPAKGLEYLDGWTFKTRWVRQ